MSWCIDRMIDILSMSRACSGSSSETCTPGTCVVDRPERPAELGGGLGLGVVRLVLGRAAVEPDQDHRQVVARRRRPPAAPRPQQVAQAQARQAQRPGLQEAPPRHPVATRERPSPSAASRPPRPLAPILPPVQPGTFGSILAASRVGSQSTCSRGRPNSDTGGEFYPLLTRPVAAPRIASSGSAPTASPPTTH